MLATSVTVLKRTTLERDLGAVRRLAAEWDAQQIVVGLPMSMSGEMGPQAQKVVEFADAVQNVVDVPVIFWDERLSTVTAGRILSEQGVKTKNQRRRIDAVAAAVILQEYLDAKNPPSWPEELP